MAVFKVKLLTRFLPQNMFPVL